MNRVQTFAAYRHMRSLSLWGANRIGWSTTVCESWHTTVECLPRWAANLVTEGLDESWTT